MSNLTAEDLQLLDDCATYDEWKATTVTIKHRHGGDYPSDWFAVMLQSGRADVILGRWGMDSKPKGMAIEPGASAEDIRKQFEVPFYPTAICKGCKRFPDQIEDCVATAADFDVNYATPSHFIRDQEGTYNRETGQFWCDTCYIKQGMPLGTA